MGAALLSLLGVFLATYLYLYKIGRIGVLACGTGGCEAVQTSPYARFLGVEVALIGAVGYLGLLVVSLIGLQPRFRDSTGPAVLLAILSGAGALFAGYLTALELFVIHAICRWCVGSAVIIAAIFAVSLADWRAARRTVDARPAPST